jgi:C1A family cysteine protease
MKAIRLLEKVIFFVLIAQIQSSCSDIDDNLEKNKLTPIISQLPIFDDGQHTDSNGVIYYTGMENCIAGVYSTDLNNLLLNLQIASNMPVSFDLSIYLPPIGNQGKQGSCTSWSTTYYMKSMQERIQAVAPYLAETVMSPSYTYNQITQGNCKGTSFEDTLDILKNKGVVPMSVFPYYDYTCLVQPTALQNIIATSNRISSYKYLSGLNMVSEMKTLLISKSPILISVFLTNKFGIKDQFGLTAYRPHAINSDTKGDCHAMLVVGYSDQYEAFKVVNSWGSAWGDNGFGWIDYSAFSQIYNTSNSFKIINQAIVVYDL